MSNFYNFHVDIGIFYILPGVFIFDYLVWFVKAYTSTIYIYIIDEKTMLIENQLRQTESNPLPQKLSEIIGT